MTDALHGRVMRLVLAAMLMTTVMIAVGATPALADTPVFINELHYDNASTDTGEFVEVAGPAGSDLSSWSLVLYNGANGLVYNTLPLPSPIPDLGGGFGVVSVSLPSNGLQNGAPDGLALVNGSTVVQFLSYEGSFNAVDGPAAGETSTDIGVEEGSSTPVGDSLQLTGTGSAYEDFSWAAPGPNTEGAFNTGQTFVGGGGGGTPEIVISEIMYNPASGEPGWEWVEVVNVGDGTADLAGWVIDDNNSNAHSSANIAAGTVPAGGSAVLYNADDVSAADFAAAWGSGINLVPVTNWTTTVMALNNGGDRIGLWNSFASYSGDNVSHTNAVEDVAYATGSGWPSSVNGKSIYLTDLAADNNVGTNWDLSDVGDVTPVNDTYQSVALGGNSGSDVGSPGANPPTVIVDPFGACFDDATAIHTIQGDGLVSPEVGNIRTIEGVVVGDFDGTGQLGGVFVQEEDDDADLDPLTSEGIFVFKGGSGTDLSIGDLVRIRGSVTEFFDLTELTSVLDLAICETADAPTPATPTFPVTAVTDLESFEGMSVEFPQQLYVTGNFTLGRFGEVDLSINGPLDNPTNVVAPGAPAIALQDLNDRSRIQLDDGSTVQNPVPVPPYFAADGTLRTGDAVDGLLSGVLSYGFGVYEVQPTGPISFTRDNPRPTVPNVGGSIQIGAFNVLNYFTTIDTGTPICGPLLNQGCRGADTADELADQRAKIVSGISQLDAEVLGLMEIENAPDDTPTADLVAGLNDVLGAGTYDYIATGAIGIDAIRLAILYQPGEVTPVGDYAVLDSTVDPSFDDTKNRPALAQTFRENATGELFTIVVNHLKSKGSDCLDVGDPDTGDGQGNCNQTRLAAARALAAWVLTDPTGQGDADYLITGDLNSYAMEDPIAALEAAAWTDLIKEYQGTGFADGAYSYNFQSQSGYLDHALASPSLADQVTDASFWHINADEPAALDYNNFNQEVLVKDDQYRSSDHDPVLVGLHLATPTGLKADARDDLAALLPTGNRQVDDRIEKAIAAIDDSLDPDLWVDGMHLGKQGHKVFDAERKAVQELSMVGGAAKAAAEAAIGQLIEADRMLAEAALAVAVNTSGDPGLIGDAQDELAAAAAATAAGDYNKAVDHYRKAWIDAVKAVGEAVFATFNASLNRFNAGDLLDDLFTPNNVQARTVAEIIQRANPDVLLINEFDYVENGLAATLFQENYLGVSQNGAEPVVYPFRYVAPSNTGIPSGFDLNNNGSVGGADDAFGFGFFPGQYGMAVFSKHPIDVSDVRTFQEFLWKDMPGALLPMNPDGTSWYSPEELDVFRLSSKSHWDVPLQVGDQTVHFLVSHPTPPVFDGPEDRNGTRNFDEIRLWADYVQPARSGYIYDDNGVFGGLDGGARFVIAGDQNSDPFDGDSIPGAAQQLLNNPKVNASLTPTSEGAVEQAILQDAINDTHIGDPKYDTADFADNAPGNLRADYVLPSKNMTMLDGAVFWPLSTDPLFALVGTYPFPSSDHRLVWIRVAVN